MTYDNILRLSDDADVNDVIRFLREREIVHFQRFGEAVQLLREKRLLHEPGADLVTGIKQKRRESEKTDSLWLFLLGDVE